MNGRGKSFAEDFSTLSDEEESKDDDKKISSIGCNEKLSSQK